MKQSVLVIVGSSTSYHHALRDQAIDGSGYDKRCHSWPSVRGMCYCSRNFLHCLVCGARDGGGEEEEGKEELVRSARIESFGGGNGGTMVRSEE